MPKKKQTKRSKSRFPGLDPSVNGKRRQEYMDQDYIDKLNDKEKQYLSEFNESYMSGNFKNGKKRKFGRTVKERRDAYNRNNARNRCQLSLARATGYAVSAEDHREGVEKISGKSPGSVEDEIIEILDIKIKNEKDE